MAKAKLIHREQGKGFPFHQQRFPCNQLDDVPTDIPVREHACPPHTGANIHNSSTQRVNMGESPHIPLETPVRCAQEGLTQPASGNGRLHPKRHLDRDGGGDEVRNEAGDENRMEQDRSGDEDENKDASARHMPAEIPVEEQFQTTLVPSQITGSKVGTAHGTRPPALGCWSGGRRAPSTWWGLPSPCSVCPVCS